MNIRPLAVTVAAPRDAVFNFLANIENLPRWAGDYCERIYLQRGGWWALTIEGELIVDMDIHADTGVIDLRTGAAPDRMHLTPVRVVALSPRRTLVSVLVIEAPDQSFAECERRYQTMTKAGHALVRRFGGGELHSPPPALALAELGLN